MDDDVSHMDDYAFDLFPLEDVEKFIIDNRFLIGKYKEFFSFNIDSNEIITPIDL